MDIRTSLATQQYAATRPATEPKPGAGGAGAAFSEVATGFAQTLQEVEAQSTKAMTGDADPHALVEALAQSQLAVDTAVTVRDRVVEAYQEILRMPV